VQFFQRERERRGSKPCETADSAARRAWIPRTGYCLDLRMEGNIDEGTIKKRREQAKEEERKALR
jgi:hypothetical protein